MAVNAQKNSIGLSPGLSDSKYIDLEHVDDGDFRLPTGKSRGRFTYGFFKESKSGG